MIAPAHIRWSRGRFVHFASTWGSASLCDRVMRWKRDEAIPTDDPVTCESCLRRAIRMGMNP